jgi:hypothetical protein
MLRPTPRVPPKRKITAGPQRTHQERITNARLKLNPLKPTQLFSQIHTPFLYPLAAIHLQMDEHYDFGDACEQTL